MRLIALKAGRYGTRALKAGDEFSADPSYGKIWKLLGVAADAPKLQPVEITEPKKRGRKPKAAEEPAVVVEELVAEPEEAAEAEVQATAGAMGFTAIEEHTEDGAHE